MVGSLKHAAEKEPQKGKEDKQAEKSAADLKDKFMGPCCLPAGVRLASVGGRANIPE